MTNDLITRARAALDGVTPSKMPSLWRVTKRYSFISHKDTWQVVRDVPNSTAIDIIADTGGDAFSDERHARFIAAARDLVPALVDEVGRLTKERDEALNQLDSARYSVEVLEKRVAHFMARAEAAEAKVEKLVEALKLYSCEDGCNDCPEQERDRVSCGWTARAALRAIGGEK